MIIQINSDLCLVCGLCGEVCPRHIPEVTAIGNQKISTLNEDRAALCMECGHCAAVCPNQAIRLDPFHADEFKEIHKIDIDGDRMLALLRQRRSVRRYRDAPVPRESIEKIIEAVHASPTGSGRMTTGVIVINNPKTLAELSRHLYQAYVKLDKALQNPVARFMIKRERGQQVFNMLQHFVMPGMRWYIRWYDEGRSNEILRDCPVLMLFHTPVSEPVGSSNCLIAAFHAILMAQVMDIGACLNDLIPPMCNRLPEIRQLLGIPEEHEVYAGITLGYPKYDYKRIIPRKLVSVHYC